MFDLIRHSLGMRKIQSVSILISVALSVMTLLAATLVYVGATEGVRVSSERGGAELMVIPSDAEDYLSDSSLLFSGVPVSIYFSVDKYDEIADLDGVERCTPQFYSQTLSDSCCSTGAETKLIGIDEATDFVVTPLLDDPDRERLGDHEVYVGSDIGYEDDGTLRILGETYQVVAVLAETGSDIDNSIVTSIDEARAISASNAGFDHLWEKYGPVDSLVSCAMLDVDDAVKDKVVRAIGNMDGLRVIERTVAIENAQSQLESILDILFALAIVMVITSVLQIFARFYSMAFDRKSELALYRAVGATTHQIRILIGGEAALLTGAGLVVGAICGFGAYYLLLNLLMQHGEFPFISPGVVATVVILLVLVLLFAVICLAAVLAPLRRIRRVDPSTAMQQGDIN